MKFVALGLALAVLVAGLGIIYTRPDSKPAPAPQAPRLQYWSAAKIRGQLAAPLGRFPGERLAPDLAGAKCTVHARQKPALLIIVCS